MIDIKTFYIKLIFHFFCFHKPKLRKKFRQVRRIEDKQNGIFGVLFLSHLKKNSLVAFGFFFCAPRPTDVDVTDGCASWATPWLAGAPLRER